MERHIIKLIRKSDTADVQRAGVEQRTGDMSQGPVWGPELGRDLSQTQWTRRRSRTGSSRGSGLCGSWSWGRHGVLRTEKGGMGCDEGEKLAEKLL